jgi:succinyl-CoA:acetate CoA-transferase
VKERIRNQDLMNNVTSAEEAAEVIKDGMIVATSGFTPAGYPKAVPLALAKRAEKFPFKINLLTGASVGKEIDTALSEAGVVKKRIPYQTDRSMRNSINNGEVEFIDLHLSHMAQDIRYGYYGEIDVAIIEVCAITEEGYLIPSTSVGNSPTFVQEAKQVIVEVNTSQPLELEGLHDIYIPGKPPKREPIPILKTDDRIGTTYIPVDPKKIAAIVVTDIKDDVRPLPPVDAISQRMAENLLDFLNFEIKKNRLPKNLLPLQSGVGGVANAVLAGMVNSPFSNLEVYTEVIQDAVFDLIDTGKVRIASGCSITVSPEGLERFNQKIDFYRDKIILRPQEISNNPEVIRRLGVIAMNTAIEVDIYGHVNSTHVLGSRLMNGIGGSGDFTRNAYLSIFTTPSVVKNGDISSIVPMVSHADHTEHDVDVVITEQGVADLRNKGPRQRAKEIIENCSHPDYRPLLRDYFERACSSTGQHIPHLLGEALSWHERLAKKGTMKVQTEKLATS